MKSFRRVVLLFALLLVPCLSVGHAAGPARPNIVFILADDLGQMDIGAFNPKTFYETPNIDALARRGMKFPQGYAACCVCSPTRGSIMTGKYPPRFGITNFIPGGRAGKLLPAPNADHLALAEVTIAETLRDAGYATFFAGKWHLGGGEFYPGAQGFPKELDNGNGAKGNAQFWYPKSDLARAGSSRRSQDHRPHRERGGEVHRRAQGSAVLRLPAVPRGPHAHRRARGVGGEIPKESRGRAGGCVGSGAREQGAARAKQSRLCRDARATRHRHRPRGRGAGAARTHRENHRRLHVRQRRSLDQRGASTSNLRCARARAGPTKAACASR